MQAVENTGKRSQKPNESVGFSAFLMGLGTLSSRILGFLRDMMMAAYFSRTVTDAWIAAFRLPNLFRRLFGEGALGVSFIPVFIGLLGKEETPESREEAKRLANGIFTILLGILIPLTALGIIFAEPVIAALTPGEGYVGVPGKIEMTVRFAQIMFVYILLVSLYAFYMSILNSFKQFWLPAFAPALWNATLVVSAFLPIEGARESGDVLAWAVVVGGVIQMGILIPPLIRRGFLPKMTFALNTKPIRQVFKAMGPSLLGLSIMQITIIVNTHFASYLPEGANSWIFWGDRILEFPLSLFSVSLGTALLPTLSQQWLRGERDSFHETSNFYLRSVFLLSIPASVGVFVLARPIVDVLFFRGQFSENDAVNTAQVLRLYSIAVFTASGVRVLAPCFYAIKNTWYPATCSLVALISHVIVVNLVIDSFGIQGLVGSTVLSAAINLVLLFAGYKVFIGPFAYAKLFRSLMIFSAMGLVLALILQVYPILVGVFGTGALPKAISLFATIGLAIVSYFGMAHLLRLEEVKPTVEKIRRRFKRV